MVNLGDCIVGQRDVLFTKCKIRLFKVRRDKDMSVNNQSRNMLTVGEASELLFVHPNTLKRWCDEGLIKAYRITPRGDRRFYKQDILQFLEQLKEGNGDKGKIGLVDN